MVDVIVRLNLKPKQNILFQSLVVKGNLKRGVNIACKQDNESESSGGVGWRASGRVRGGAPRECRGLDGRARVYFCFVLLVTSGIFIIKEKAKCRSIPQFTSREEKNNNGLRPVE